MKHSSGKFRSMGGAGIALVSGISGYDLNPAGISKENKFIISFSQNLDWYRYSLMRSNPVIGATTFDIDNFSYSFENINFLIPINNDLALAAGYLEKIDPYTTNLKIAPTFSILFNHYTKEKIHAFTVSGGYRLIDSLLFGINLYIYSGKITSSIAGDNHGNDKDKWALLESKMNGWNIRAGFQYLFKDFNLGLAIETPFNINVNAEKYLSSNKLYEFYLPNYESTTWKMPWIITIGAGVKFSKDFEAALDLEARL